MSDQPRWLSRAGVAAYIDVKEAAIARLVKAGKLPEPSYQLGPKQPRWDRLAIDACFTGDIVRSEADEMDEAVKRVIQKILDAPRRKQRQRDA